MRQINAAHKTLRVKVIKDASKNEYCEELAH
jgi:hypothetical protein